MIYKLVFDPRALKEWNKLGDPIRQQLKKKLAEILQHPHIEANKLGPVGAKLQNATFVLAGALINNKP